MGVGVASTLLRQCPGAGGLSGWWAWRCAEMEPAVILVTDWHDRPTFPAQSSEHPGQRADNLGGNPWRRGRQRLGSVSLNSQV